MSGAAALPSSSRFEHPILRAPAAWVIQACGSLDLLLIDHANCEKKAASTALALMFAYAEDLLLTDKMSRIAREELRHYEQVAQLMTSLGIIPQRLAPGRYAQALRRLVARTEPEREVDLMICGALIEARSCERFALLAPAIGGAAAVLFAGLHAAEARHYRVYLDLARRAAARSGIDLASRLAAFALLEGQLATGVDEVFRFHSGPPATSGPPGSG
jgi:tRNA-(ms[2]io[6]A)-hydroxylase